MNGNHSLICNENQGPLRILNGPQSKTAKLFVKKSVPNELAKSFNQSLEQQELQEPNFKTIPIPIDDQSQNIFLSVEEMVRNVIMDNDRGPEGVSLHAIKKFLVIKYGISMENYAEQIRKCLVQGVHEHCLVRVSGAGANGSFRIDPAGVRLKPVKKSENKEPSKVVSKPLVDDINNSIIEKRMKFFDTS